MRCRSGFSERYDRGRRLGRRMDRQDETLRALSACMGRQDETLLWNQAKGRGTLPVDSFDRLRGPGGREHEALAVIYSWLDACPQMGAEQLSEGDL